MPSFLFHSKSSSPPVLTSESSTALDFCKTRLQWLVTEWRSRKHRIIFHFHIGDCIDLCRRNESMWNKFHVIYTFDLADRHAGLANLIPAALDCLSIENPQSLLLTETTAWVKLENPTVSEFVEISLGCPLSLVPTLYGVRLVNHHRLGSPDCLKLHDFLFTKPVTLQGLRAPAYSDNVVMGISPSFKMALERLAELCFETPKILSPSGTPFFYPGEFARRFLSTLLSRDVLLRSAFAGGTLRFLSGGYRVPLPVECSSFSSTDLANSARLVQWKTCTTLPFPKEEGRCIQSYSIS